MSDPNPSSPAMERRTICFPDPASQRVMQSGDVDFKTECLRLYTSAENNALEGLIDLKARLRTVSTDDFWEAATEGMSKVLGAEMTFIMKRVLVDEQEAAVEMPPHGAPGSCMMAAAFHYCSNDGSRNTIKQSKFAAYGCPCAYMRHDKVFLIPEKLNDFIVNNPNKLPSPAESYIAVPLFADDKCFAHFGVMWSKESSVTRQLSWAFIELLLHSLEDMIHQRLIQGSNFIRPAAPRDPQRVSVIPHDAVTIAQSLRPYAGSLSHELRTPMQGVVGMLDVMYATVQEAVETQRDPKLRKIFQDLKANIEVVQDSSRRAVEAADNVVHAYDMNMSVPEAPAAMPFDDSIESMSPMSANVPDRRPEILVAGSNLPLSRPNKRRRDEAFSSRHNSQSGNSKTARLSGSLGSRMSEPSREAKQGLMEAEEVQHNEDMAIAAAEADDAHRHANFAGVNGQSRTIAPGLRHANMREVFKYVINEGLKLGGRPDSAIAQETEDGETIEVRSRGSDGSASTKLIEWSVDASVPHTMFIDERDLTKLISCVFLNAVKFTDQSAGRIGVHARMSSRGRYILIKISDNGPGIPAAFLPKLFQPFSRENGSITRPSEGLGLGLLVAKGIARKLGGDLSCTRAETEGPAHGSEFEIKVPLQAGETITRPSSPFGSPVPRRAQPVSTETPHIPPLAPSPIDPRNVTRALQQAIDGPLLTCSTLPQTPIKTPPSPKSTHPDLAPPKDASSSDSPRASSPPSPEHIAAPPRPRIRKSISHPEIDRNLASKYPLTFLVAEDNKINRKLLVSMLSKFGYKSIHEAHDGAEAVRQMAVERVPSDQIDVVLMDIWMPLMDGYEATQRILSMPHGRPTVLAVTADVTDDALERAAQVGMTGYMTKPYKMLDLQRLITEYCAWSNTESANPAVGTSGIEGAVPVNGVVA